MRKYELEWNVEKELKKISSFKEGVELLGLKDGDFTFINDDCMDFDFIYINEDGRNAMITFTINDDVEGDELLSDLKLKNGYWHMSEEIN